MKICIYGAGAIGGLIGARLSAQGAKLSVVARGETLRAIGQRGIGLAEGDQPRFYPATAVADPARLGPQDLVVVAVKQPALHEILPRLQPLLGTDTRVLLAMNGVPWWFFDGLPGAVADPVLRTVDPEGSLSTTLPSDRIIGCVIHIAASTEAPGISRLHMGDRLILGDAPGGLFPSPPGSGRNIWPPPALPPPAPSRSSATSGTSSGAT